MKRPRPFESIGCWLWVQFGWPHRSIIRRAARNRTAYLSRRHRQVIDGKQ